MLQLRPTFSESWYRVKDLRAKLRPSTQISRQYYRGERWYVVRDPAGNQFHRLSDAAYRFVGLLDGSRTVGEAWELVGGQLADDAPTQPEVIQILSQLHSANLLETDVSADAMVLLRRHKQQMKQKMQGRLMNILFPRIPIWDPDRFLCRWMPVVRPLLSKIGAIVWLIVVMAAVVAIVPRWEDVAKAARNSIAPGNWLWLWAVFVGIKFIHECGHAFACRRFGGEVHEMGIMFLVFIPTPYVDASTAWAFPSRWARMFVGAAGMIVELFVASILAFVWLNTNPNELINQLAYNAMLIASVSTIVFNANPLLRYDGYYMLSDFLEIPNLQRKSTEYILGLVKRHDFRV
jgi:putative peptide zinc metalloprotease protein